MMDERSDARGLVTSAYLAAGAFGAFWGGWGASIPRIREQAGVDDGRLGLALLFIGAGALPAMLLAGRALDRWGLRFAAAAVTVLGVAGLVVSLTAHSFVGLCAGLTVVGATSGAADVAMNSVAGRAEERTGRSIILRAGGVFSTFVVLSSLATGFASWIGLPVFVPFLVVAILSGIGSVVSLGALAQAAPAVGPRGTTRPGRRAATGLVPLLLVGTLGALAFASENAHQSWGAAFLEDELGAGPGFSAIGPAVFACVVAVTRFSVGTVRRGRERRVLVLGSLTAGVGALVISASESVVVAVGGLVLAAAGTAALFPTMLSIVSRTVDEAQRGRATAIVTTVSYMGFILGPVYVGLWAQGTGLRGAMVAVAAVGVVLAALSSPLLEASGYAHALVPRRADRER